MTNYPIIKLCGNNSIAAIEKIKPLLPDWWGFIFYKKSKRYFSDTPLSLQKIPQKKIGVFVNEKIDAILKIVHAAKLDMLQLHGDESPEDCKILSQEVPIIKVVGVNEAIDNNKLLDYSPYIRYFLFDTASPKYGGTGIKFDRTFITVHYKLTVPYILSGGIDYDEALSLLINPPQNMIGIDINSQFESAPAVKDNARVQQLLKQVYAIRNNSI